MYIQYTYNLTDNYNNILNSRSTIRSNKLYNSHLKIPEINV